MFPDGRAPEAGESLSVSLAAGVEKEGGGSWGVRALSPDPLDTPLLAMLSEQGVKHAESAKVEWLIEVWRDGDTSLQHDFNYMQINRTPFAPNLLPRKED